MNERQLYSPGLEIFSILTKIFRLMMWSQYSNQTLKGENECLMHEIHHCPR